jgi:hypothetical protein
VSRRSQLLLLYLRSPRRLPLLLNQNSLRKRRSLRRRTRRKRRKRLRRKRRTKRKRRRKSPRNPRNKTVRKSQIDLLHF